MTQTKTIICKKHGEQEIYFIEHYGADGIRNDMVFCKICRDSCKIDLGLPNSLITKKPPF